MKYNQSIKMKYKCVVNLSGVACPQTQESRVGQPFFSFAAQLCARPRIVGRDRNETAKPQMIDWKALRLNTSPMYLYKNKQIFSACVIGDNLIIFNNISSKNCVYLLFSFLNVEQSQQKSLSCSDIVVLRHCFKKECVINLDAFQRRVGFLFRQISTN